MDVNKLVLLVVNFIVIVFVRVVIVLIDILKFLDIIIKVIFVEIILIIEDCCKRLSIFCLFKNDGVVIFIVIYKVKKFNNIL